MLKLLALVLAISESAIGAVVHPPRCDSHPRNYKGTTNNTHCGTDFRTWWHNSGEINTQTPVQPGNVRQSHKYSVQVSLAGANTFYDSFVYESIPRNGNGRIYAPTDLPGSNTLDPGVDDGISIEPGIGLNMAWSQFEYSQDVDIKILAIDGSSLGSPSDVVIRPVSISYAISQSSDGGIVIRIPADANGRKFSVEFKNDLYTFLSDGNEYVTSGGTAVGVEPTNALVIFASPFLPSGMIPHMTTYNTQTMTPGPINNGDWGSKPILYFPPGVYWMNQDQSGNSGKLGSNHMRLNSNTYWVYFAPGAYVKGAIEYFTKHNFYATGHGVLSGENYVYQANAADNYVAVKSDTTSLRMWWHNNLGVVKHGIVLGLRSMHRHSTLWILMETPTSQVKLTIISRLEPSSSRRMGQKFILIVSCTMSSGMSMMMHSKSTIPEHLSRGQRSGNVTMIQSSRWDGHPGISVE